MLLPDNTTGINFQEILAATTGISYETPVIALESRVPLVEQSMCWIVFLRENIQQTSLYH
jgi:hypothetical protein